MHALGLDIVRYPGRLSSLGRRKRLLDYHRIDVVCDVGANVGQYGRELRRLGFAGRIVSFEPLPAAFEELSRVAAGDPRWEVAQVAMGDRAGEATLHVAGNSASSSMLEMLPAHLEAAPDSRYVGDVQVTMSTLDDELELRIRADERLFLKVDAQGYEAHILAGATRSLDRIQGLQLELSLVPLYAGAPTLASLVREIEDRGFTLMSVEPGFIDVRSGQLLQVDGVFFRVRPGSGGATMASGVNKQAAG